MIIIYILSFIVVLVAGASIYNYYKNKQDNEPFAAGIDFDLNKVETFLKHLSSSILDSGFSKEAIKSMQTEIDKMNKDNEFKELGIFDVTYKGQPTKIRIEAEIQIEDDEKDIVLYMYSIKELVEVIEAEMMEIEGAFA